MKNRWLRSTKPKVLIPTLNLPGKPHEDGGPNRADRKANIRRIKRITRHPDACLTLEHELLEKPTRYGIKKLATRRHTAAIAKLGRQRSQLRARNLRVKRQKRAARLNNG